MEVENSTRNLQFKYNQAWGVLHEETMERYLDHIDLKGRNRIEKRGLGKKNERERKPIYLMRVQGKLLTRFRLATSPALCREKR